MEAHKIRSIAANRYRWGVVVKTVLDHINEELKREGTDIRVKPEDVDIFIKDKALKTVHKINTSLGEITIIGKLKQKSKGEFEESMEQIRAYFAQKGIFIPLPNEIDFENQYNDNLNRF